MDQYLASLDNLIAFLEGKLLAIEARQYLNGGEHLVSEAEEFLSSEGGR